MALFYSKSKDLELRYLSNFEECEVSYEGRNYKSVEKGFQGLKYIISGYESIGKKFEVGNEYDKLSDSEIKRMGGKGGFKKNGCELNIVKWNKIRVGIMRVLIKSRYENDEKFRKILDKYDKVFHFERGGEKSFWGGNWKKEDVKIEANFRGKNKLGEIMMEMKWKFIDSDFEEDSDYEYEYEEVWV